MGALHATDDNFQDNSPGGSVQNLKAAEQYGRLQMSYELPL